MGTRNRIAIGRRVLSDSFVLAMAMNLASSSAISREIALSSFLAAAFCLVAPFDRSESGAADTTFNVVLEFESSREGRGGGRSSTAMNAAVSSLPRAVGAFRFDMVGCIMLDRRHLLPASTLQYFKLPSLKTLVRNTNSEHHF